MGLWDVATGRENVRLLGEVPWSSAAFSPDGRAIVALEVDGSVWWWDVAGVVGGGN